MNFKAKNNLFLSVLYVALFLVASITTGFCVFWLYYHGVSSGNKGVDLYIFYAGSCLVFSTLIGIIHFILTRNSGIDVPYLIYMWIIYITVSVFGILFVKLGFSIPENDNTLYVMLGISLVLGITGCIAIVLVQKKRNDKRYEKLKEEIKERKEH